MKTLIAEVITIVVFWPLRVVSRLGGRRANAKVRDWQDGMWTWWLGAAAVGYLVGDQYIGGSAEGAVGHYDGSHDYSGGHDVGGGFDGGGFGGDIGGF